MTVGPSAREARLCVAALAGGVDGGDRVSGDRHHSPIS
jgi:hypothetical protein